VIVMIDNFDSFTYNIVQSIEAAGVKVVTVRNNAVTLAEIEALEPAGIVISPGPGTPDDAGISRSVIRHFYRQLPILGVCLGHQCIAAEFGGRVVSAQAVMHGKLSSINHAGQGLFAGLPQGFKVVRYHSLAAEQASLPKEFTVDARTADGEIMAITHREFPLYGVQFHPESIATECGEAIIHKFIAITREVQA